MTEPSTDSGLTWVNGTLFWLISILSGFKVPNFKLTQKILMSMFYKLILQLFTLMNIKIRYRVPCGATRKSCFSSQHWSINQYATPPLPLRHWNQYSPQDIEILSQCPAGSVLTHGKVPLESWFATFLVMVSQ